MFFLSGCLFSKPTFKIKRKHPILLCAFWFFQKNFINLQVFFKKSVFSTFVAHTFKDKRFFYLLVLKYSSPSLSFFKRQDITLSRTLYTGSAFFFLEGNLQLWRHRLNNIFIYLRVLPSLSFVFCKEAKQLPYLTHYRVAVFAGRFVLF